MAWQKQAGSHKAVWQRWMIGSCIGLLAACGNGIDEGDATTHPQDGDTTAQTVSVQNDSYHLASNSRLLEVSAPGVLANDKLITGKTYTLQLLSTTSHGTLTLDDSGHFRYLVARDFSGQDSFSYAVVIDGVQSAPALVTLQSDEATDPDPVAPIASNDDYTLPTGEGKLAVAAPGLLANDTQAQPNQTTIRLIMPPLHGSLSLQTDGAFSYLPGNTFSGSDSFSYQLANQGSLSAPATVTLHQERARSLPLLAIHPGGISYWDNPYLADAMSSAIWLEATGYDWGKQVAIWNNPQFDNNGFPRYLNEGTLLRAILTGLHMQDTRLVSGHVVLTWKGSGDLRLSNNSDYYLAAESNGDPNGVVHNGRRVYRFPQDDHLNALDILTIDPKNPITEIHVWLADPAAPQDRSLEGQLWHPTLLARLADFPHSVLRTMDLTITNGNPQQDWSDRRRPGHYSQAGLLNPRSPAPGALAWDGNPYPGGRETGVAWEYLVQLANSSQHDLWINIPHMATTEYIDKLARLIRYGSDGNEPYSAPVSKPIYPPLDSQLRVWLEYSNEIWSGGIGFAQGEWAAVQAMAQQPPLSKAQFNGRQFCHIWDRFNLGLGDKRRVMKVLATFTANRDYNEQLFSEVASYCPTLPSQISQPDVIAVTTYLGNGIQDWVHQHAQDQASTDDPWFYTKEHFDAGDGNMRPVSLAADNDYWQSHALERHLRETTDEWKRRLLAGDASEGEGPDATGLGGGFENSVNKQSLQYFHSQLPLVAYEGGPSIYTDGMDGGDERDDGITSFMVRMNNETALSEIYRIHLNMAAAKGLQMHTPYTLSGSWGKYGQWGHLSHLADDPATSVKYQALLQWQHEEGRYNPVFSPKDAVPRFTTEGELEASLLNTPMERQLYATGGDGPLTLEIIGSVLVPGIQAEVTGDAIRVWGSPTRIGTSYLYARVSDSNGDRGWRIFTLRTIQRSTDPEVTITFDNTPLQPFATPLSEPFVVTDSSEQAKYQFTSTGNRNLLLEYAFPELGWFDPWPTPVLLAQYYNGRIRMSRQDGKTFDLYSLDLASTYGQSAVIRAEGLDGYVQEITVNLPLSQKMTRATPDLIDIYNLEVRWYLERDGQGEPRMGAIDNLQINHKP